MSGLKRSQHLRLSFKAIQVATNNFETCIGQGGFGGVYKGKLSISGQPTTVAVKRLNEQSRLSGQGLKEFLTEIELLTGQRHPNLITLIGYCDEGCENIIVYEYAERGSLDQYIRNNISTTYTLTWAERVKICIDAARGLDHLHSHVGKHQTIIHRDIKSANILLDENWVAKISDLGLSKLCLAGLDRSAVISHPCGTFGYWDPEYISTGIVTKKSDVYSFGMVLFEVLCWKLCNIIDKDGFSFSAKLAKECYVNNKLHEIIDPNLREQMSSNSISKFSAIAYRCLHDDREQRPTMDVVKKELEETLKIQLSVSLWGEGITEEAPMDTQIAAIQPVFASAALQEVESKPISISSFVPDLQVEQLTEISDIFGTSWLIGESCPGWLKLPLKGDDTTEAAPMDIRTVDVAIEPIPVPPALQVDELKLSLWGNGTEATPIDAQAVAVEPISISVPFLQVNGFMVITDNLSDGAGILGRGGQTATNINKNLTNQPDQDILAQNARTEMLDDMVIIKQGNKEDEATVITINCPDKIGLGCDLCWTILSFGLSIVRGDLSTDGKWCYIVFWVIKKPGIKWRLVRERLLEACPSVSSANTLVYYQPESQSPKPEDVFLIKLCYHDRQGLLNDVIHLLCELELYIQRAKVSTTPDGKVIDLFYIKDTRELLMCLLMSRTRREEFRDRLKAVLGDDMISCDIDLVCPDFTMCSHCPPSFIPLALTEGTLYLESKHAVGVSVLGDNSFSPSHTLLQIVCHDYKGLLYDIMRTLKEYNIQISYGRLVRKETTVFELDFLIVQADGKKIDDPSKLDELCSRIKMELCRPLRVVLVNRGPDTELLVASPVELCGRSRPLVFANITLALKMLNTDIFSAEVSRHLIASREWEIYRVLLDERDELSLPKGRIEEAVWKMLMGWDHS